MSEGELFRLLRDKPGLRLAVARTPEEHQEALIAYRKMYYPGTGTDSSLIRTQDVRRELIELLEQRNAK